MRVSGQRRMASPTVVAAGFAAFLALTLAMPIPPDPVPVAGMQASRNGQRLEASTPVATDAVPHDPLHGDPPADSPPAPDPLDGEPPGRDLPREDPGAPNRQERFEIERSGRPRAAESSSVAYDDDPETIWIPEDGVDESWLWFDVGDGRRVRVVRWLADGSGTIDVAVSNDRERWETLESVEASPGWDGVRLREDARYVRLTVRAADEGEPPGIAEVAIYGRFLGAGAAAEQEAAPEPERRRDRQRNRERRAEREASPGVESQQDAGESATTGNGQRRSGGQAGGRTRISAEAGETRCRGERRRCRAREGRVSVEEDCARGGTCTIDIRADGGSAVCDATGGRGNRAGDGEGRRAGEGGECEAVADGGTVTIGDINP